MKNFRYVLVGVLVLVSGLSIPKVAVATEVVGDESYTASWHAISGGASKYQLYFGQADTGKKDTTVENLEGNSKEVILSYLKPCTTYSWNLKSLRNGTWDWEWSNDRMFTTNGSCAKSSAGTPTAKIVGTASGIATWPVITGAEYYNVYYRANGYTEYTGGVRVPASSNSLTINYLGAGTYYYRVAGMVNGQEVWLPEKVLKGGSASQPVLGTVSNTQTMVKPTPKTAGKQAVSTTKTGKTALQNPRIGGTVAGTTTGTTMTTASKLGIARVVWTNPGGVNKYHVYYWTSSTDQHALRNLDSSANRVTISSLNANKSYWYRVQAIKDDGTAVWLSNAKILNVE